MQRLQIECAAWSCGLILHYCLPSNLLFFFFFFFSGTILSGLHLWNRYSQRLQIECTAWSCGLILHYCLPSNSLRYFFFFFFFHDFVRAYLWNRYSQRLQIECAAWSCSLILHCCLPSNSLRYFFFFFRHDFVRRRVFSSSGDRSSVAYRATGNLSRFCFDKQTFERNVAIRYVILLIFAMDVYRLPQIYVKHRRALHQNMFFLGRLGRFFPYY